MPNRPSLIQIYSDQPAATNSDLDRTFAQVN